MGNDIYLNMIKESPIPCIWFSFEKDLNDTLCGINILGYNEKIKISSKKEISIDKLYNLDGDSFKNLYDVLKNNKKTTLVEFIDILGYFCEIDIITISDNIYVIWFTKKIEIDKDKTISDSKILNLLSDNIPDGIFVKDNKGIFIHCNKVFAQNRNLRKEDIIGESEKYINTPDEKIENYKCEEEQIRTSKEYIISNSEYIGDDGRTRYYEVLKIPFLDNFQNVGGVLGISRDISHRKEAELEFERLRMEFFANLSHEFKTPLNLVFSSIQLIEYMIDKGESSDKYKIYTKIIKQNGYRILKMVNNLIDSTRLSAGCIEYNPQNYNIVEFIENICDSVQYYAKEENIEVVFDTDIEEKIIAFDLEKMERIMLNVLSNAIKYSKEKGKVEVILKFEDDYLKIKVKDDGIGIPEDKLDDVFKLFKQVSNRITKASEGSGIGLSIVKSLVDLHEGKINVYSEKDIGSEFVIEIPISLCEENKYGKKHIKYNKYVENIDIEFSDIYASIK